MRGANTDSFNPGVVQLASALAEGCGELVALVDREGVVRLLNGGTALADLLGYEDLALTRDRLVELVHPEDIERVQEVYLLVHRQPGTRLSVQYRARHQDGRWLSLQSTGVNQLGDSMLRAMVVHTRLLAPAYEIVDESTDSGVSGWVDKPGFLRLVGETVRRKFDEVWSVAGYEAPSVTDLRYEYTVLLIELDRFKMLLGSHGQRVVDQMLSEIAERLKTVVGRKDVLSHLGGGELGMLVRGVGDAAQATRLADRIQDIVAEQIRVEGQSVSTSAIVGLATSQRRYECAEDVMSDAAAALNRARREHRRRRRAAFQTRMRVEDKEVVTLLAELPAALKKREFVLHYQPIVSLANGRLSGFEALIRWRHPERGLIQPAQFISLAEQTGFIVELGEWVVREACLQMVRWQKSFADHSPSWVSVNVSVEQIGEDLPRRVERVLGETRLEPDHLKLETTESAVMKNRDAATEVLASLKHSGVSLSLDDFGTGYSSFSVLQQLPYDTLKIDRSFVAQVGEDEGRDDIDPRDIIAAMINLAHALKMDVVAEGVETVEQVEWLAELDCDLAQGFYFAHPLESRAATELISTRPRW